MLRISSNENSGISSSTVGDGIFTGSLFTVSVTTDSSTFTAGLTGFSIAIPYIGERIGVTFFSNLAFSFSVSLEVVVFTASISFSSIPKIGLITGLKRYSLEGLTSSRFTSGLTAGFFSTGLLSSSSRLIIVDFLGSLSKNTEDVFAGSGSTGTVGTGGISDTGSG